MDTNKFVHMDKSKPNCLRVLVLHWHKRFSDGCVTIGDSKRSGRPKSDTENALKSVK